MDAIFAPARPNLTLAGVIVYIMVTGTPPFNGADDRAIMKAVSKGVFEWPRNLRVSDSLKDLVAKLLTKNPDKRMTALQALEHPWIAGAATNSDESLGETLSALKDFSNASKIKKAVANILVKQMTEEDIKKLSNLFQTLDVDGDGTLDVAEIAQYMKRLFNYDEKTAKEQAGNFLKEVDVDNSGKIDVKEFQAAHVRGQLGVVLLFPLSSLTSLSSLSVFSLFSPSSLSLFSLFSLSLSSLSLYGLRFL